MINLLRKIRKSLIASGSARKYILYALGEIALVVIGILIALQINRWQEAQKSNQWEKFYLIRIMDEIESNKKEVEITQERNYRRILAAKILLQRLGEYNYLQELSNFLPDKPNAYLDSISNLYQELESEFQEYDYSKLISHLSFLRRVSWNSSTFNELMANGRLEVIRDSDLRESISNYYYNLNDKSDAQIYVDRDFFVFRDRLDQENIALKETRSMALTDLIKNKEGMITSLKNLIYIIIQSHHLYGTIHESLGKQLLTDIENYLKHQFN